MLCLILLLWPTNTYKFPTFLRALAAWRLESEDIGAEAAERRQDLTRSGKTREFFFGGGKAQRQMSAHDVDKDETDLRREKIVW